MPTAVRLRTDDCWMALEAARRARGTAPYRCPCESHRDVNGQCIDPECTWNEGKLAAIVPATPGDYWRITWHAAPEKLAGFAICCPKCKEIHHWTSANNCGSKRQITITTPGGTEHKAMTCDHQQRHESCWTWTLDETGKPIRAVASLFANGPGMCGYHGFLGGGGAPDGFLSDG